VFVRLLNLCIAAQGDIELTTTGMLVVDTVVPGSMTDGKLESGDVLVKVQGQVCLVRVQVQIRTTHHGGQPWEVVGVQREAGHCGMRQLKCWDGRSWPARGLTGSRCKDRATAERGSRNASLLSALLGASL